MDLEKNIYYVMKSTGTLIYKSIKKNKEDRATQKEI